MSVSTAIAPVSEIVSDSAPATPLDAAIGTAAENVVRQLMSARVAGEAADDALGNMLETSVALCVLANVATVDDAAAVNTKLWEVTRARRIGMLSGDDAAQWAQKSRDVRTKERNTLRPEVRACHKEIESSYPYKTSCSRVVEALATVPSFGATFQTFMDKSSGVRALSAVDLVAAARAALKGPAATPSVAAESTGETVSPDAPAAPMTRVEILTNTAAQLRAIGDDVAADAVLALIATLEGAAEAPAQDVAPIAGE